MKAIMFAAQNIASGAVDVMVAGGMDSMSNAPFLLKRAEPKYGGDRLVVRHVLIARSCKTRIEIECGVTYE